MGGRTKALQSHAAPLVTQVPEERIEEAKTVEVRRIPRSRHRSSGASMNIFKKFFEELDKFADDAVGRRLGQGAKFYGKRKSAFYGDDDSMKKEDPNTFDREEDYTGM